MYARNYHNYIHLIPTLGIVSIYIQHQHGVLLLRQIPAYMTLVITAAFKHNAVDQSPHAPNIRSIPRPSNHL